MIFVRIILLVVVAVALADRTDTAPALVQQCVIARGETLYTGSKISGKESRLADRAHYEKLDEAKRCFYVLHQSNKKQTQLKVLECDSHGLLRRVLTVADERLKDTTAILEATVIADHRLYILLHINPSLEPAGHQ